MALRLSGDGFAVAAIRPKGVDRPWSPAAPDDETAPDSSPSRASPARPLDATPAEADRQAED
jgi:competence protein ComEC